MSSGIYLGFDYGRKRIGVAIGDVVTGSARGIGAVAEDWDAIGKLLQEWQPAACVVGLPLGLDGEDQPITTRARAFARTLGERSKKPVHLADERFSSRSALGELKQMRADGQMTRRIRKGDKDSAAARLILEQWMGENGERRT